MNAKEFMNAVANGDVDAVQVLLDLLSTTGAAYCVIGGLAVNAYAEPVVSLDLDIVVAADRIDDLREAAEAKGLGVQAFEHSVNLTVAGSDLRIQVQTDPRYQAFIPRAADREVLGYHLRVAALADVLQGKVWAHADPHRRASKRHKDLADILRLVEAHPALRDALPPGLLEHVD